MAATMNADFDPHQTAPMLVQFDQYRGVDATAGFYLRTLITQLRSLAKVDKYAVVGAPAFAAGIVDVTGRIIPTDARTFAATELAKA